MSQALADGYATLNVCCDCGKRQKGAGAAFGDYETRSRMFVWNNTHIRFINNVNFIKEMIEIFVKGEYRNYCALGCGVLWFSIFFVCFRSDSPPPPSGGQGLLNHEVF